MLRSRVKVWLVLFLPVFCNGFCAASVEDNKIDSDFKKYKPTWESLDTRPLPDWYDQYKVGIFVHWGVYTVPSFGTEWFWTNWEGSRVPKYVDFMKNNYKPRFTYQEFANDFTAELFDPDQWAKLFKDSGALYVVVTSKHHDGYALWPNTRSFSWNSKDIGPNRNIIKELADAIRKQPPLVFGLYYSLFEWFNRLYLEDKRNGFKTQTYVRDKVLPDLKEIISLYEPEVIWSDGDWEAKPEYWNSTEFLAWLYNSSPVRDTVVTNDRWGSGVLCAHGDFFTCSDRYNPGVLIKHKWENAFTLDKTSWGQRFDTTLKDYMTPEELIAEIVITVSCGGNVLVNVGPTRHGTIQPIFEERLRTMGKWLKINGEAIYLSKPWIYQNDTQTPGVWYTQKNTGARTYVYAMVLNYPYLTNEISLYALRGKLDENSYVSLLGHEGSVKAKYDEEKLRIIFPPKNIIDHEGLELAWTFKISIPS